jgi:hypothetical protein
MRLAAGDALHLRHQQAGVFHRRTSLSMRLAAGDDLHLRHQQAGVFHRRTSLIMRLAAETRSILGIRELEAGAGKQP